MCSFGKSVRILIEETSNNEQDLESFMTALNDGRPKFCQLVISLSCLFMVLFLDKNNKLMLESTVLLSLFVQGVPFIQVSLPFLN